MSKITIDTRAARLVRTWYGLDTLSRLREERRLTNASLRQAYATLARRIRNRRAYR